MSDTNILLVPMRVDALVISETDQKSSWVMPPSAQFNKMPWADQDGDHHAATPYLGSSFVSKPFPGIPKKEEQVDKLLKVGIHLHWALPASLAQSSSEDGSYRRVPNRWLITAKDPQGLPMPKGQWIVESDYLSTERPVHDDLSDGLERADNEYDKPVFTLESDLDDLAVKYPSLPDPTTGQFQSSHWQGRAIPFPLWEEKEVERIERLTAIGYGEPSYASYYPNCPNIFGIRVPMPPGNGSYHYEVLGWYSDPQQDELGIFVADFCQEYSKTGNPPSATVVQEAIEEAFGWTYSTEEGMDPPTQLVCYARATIVNPESLPENPALSATVGLGIGVNGIEALAAYTAATIDAQQQAILEDQLVAMSMGAELGQYVFDHGPRFEEARHRSGFVAVDGGTLYSIQALSTNAGPSQAENKNTPMPELLVEQLNKTNLFQTQFDRANFVIESYRERIFADWNRYMMAKHPRAGRAEDYPSPDAIREYMSFTEMEKLKLRIAKTGPMFCLVTDDQGEVISVKVDSPPPDSLSANLVNSINKLLGYIRSVNFKADAAAKIKTHNDKAKAPYHWILRVASAPRYWQPHEPTLVIAGQAVASTIRMGTNELLDCTLMEKVNTENKPELFKQIQAEINDIEQTPGHAPIAFNTIKEQPWNPILLQWEAAVYPVENGSNLYTPDQNYEPTYITGTYQLKNDALDLSTQIMPSTSINNQSIYQGESILSDYAHPQLQQSIQLYLLEQDEVLKAFDKAKGIPPGDRDPQWLMEHLDKLLEWYENHHPREASDPVYTALRALDVLRKIPTLSQSLNGFHASLQMLQHSLELPVADPLANPSELPFIHNTYEAVGSIHALSPDVNAVFQPIRTGAMKLTKLRLVDTFGRYRDILDRFIVTSTPFSHEYTPNLLSLSPRLAKPARLNFRWLAADGSMESNDHPVTTPVSGWLVVNRLDRSLVVYDADGNALGAIVSGGGLPWQPIPGGATINPEDIADPTLRQVILQVLNSDPTYRAHFQLAVENALEVMAPHGLTRAPGLAMLVSRPLAITRASVWLEGLGLPSMRQDWAALSPSPQEYGQRRTDNYTNVTFPVRIGDYDRLNDGLAGYWVETDDGALGSVFHAPKSTRGGYDGDDSSEIRIRSNDPDNLTLSLNSPGVRLTLLVDPTGSVHATSGINPAKEITIPFEYVHTVMNSMDYTFLTTPILSPAAQVQLPLRDEPGFAWSWLQKTRDGWDEIDSIGILRLLIVLNHFGEIEGAKIWNELLSKKWITPLDSMTGTIGSGAEAVDYSAMVARVAPKDQRSTTSLAPEFDPYLLDIDALLLRSTIGTVEPHATFTGPQILREGWLQLRQNDDDNNS